MKNKNIIRRWLEKQEALDRFQQEIVYYYCFSPMPLYFLMNDLLPNQFPEYLSKKDILCNMNQIFIKNSIDEIVGLEFKSCVEFRFEVGQKEFKKLSELKKYNDEMRMRIVQFLQIHRFNVNSSYVGLCFDPGKSEFTAYLALCPRGIKIAYLLNYSFEYKLMRYRHRRITQNSRIHELELKKPKKLKVSKDLKEPRGPRNE